VLYPLTERGFDGIAWITPWFMVANYLVLGVTGLLLFCSINPRSKRSAPEPD
jgi:hypothetical protein